MPDLKLLIFATTANKDAKVEEYIRQKDIENSSNGHFKVDIASWEDIVDLMERYPQHIIGMSIIVSSRMQQM